MNSRIFKKYFLNNFETLFRFQLFADIPQNRCTLKMSQISQENSCVGVSCKIWKIIKNTSFYRTPPVAASVFLVIVWGGCFGKFNEIFCEYLIALEFTNKPPLTLHQKDLFTKIQSPPPLWLSLFCWYPVKPEA